MPPKKVQVAKKDTKKKKDEEEEEEVTKKPTRSSSRGKSAPPAKADTKKDTKNDTKKAGKKKEPSPEPESEEEEAKKPAKGAKGKAKGAAKGAAKKGAAKKKDASPEKDDKKPDKDEDEKKKPAKGGKASKKAAAKADSKKDDEKDEKIEDEKKDDAKAKPKRSRSKGKDDEDEPTKPEPAKTKIDKDAIEVPVDEAFHRDPSAEVYITSDKIWSDKLNQTNIKGNNNKFYFLQLLHSKNTGKYWTHFRWGRVGELGQYSSQGPYDLNSAKKDYDKKLHDKSVKGDYKVIPMNYSKGGSSGAAGGSGADDEVDYKSHIKTSKLEKPIAEYISLIFDKKMMNAGMVNLGYDVKKMPLGKLDIKAIEEGYSILKKISDELNGKKNNSKLVEYSSEFYTYIPHDFGRTNMAAHTIKDEEHVKKKLDLLDSLKQVAAANKLNEQKSVSENPVDAAYAKLKCDFEIVKPGSKVYKQIENYIENTKGWANVKINHVFKIEREGEDARFTKDLDNHLMLWHGSRLTNFVGILSQGLRIAPPEAPASGYRLGKGIYLADMFEKSHGYCWSYGSNNTFSILLCEGALGNMNELLHDDYNASNLPKGKHSTKALGGQAPPESSYEKLADDDNVLIPQGKPTNTKYNGKSSFHHNEFIVYDLKQVKLRYVLWMQDK